MANAQGTETLKESKLAWWRNEDWLTVWLGFLIIALVLAGVRPELPKFIWAGWGELASKVLATGNIWKSAQIGIALLILSTIGVKLIGGNITKYIIGFPIVYALSWLSQLIAGNSTVSYWGVEYVIFALLIGLLISNTLSVPSWIKEAIKTEYYIKTGLVILGASILFQEILKAGALGIVQALLVVTGVWYVAFWLSKKLSVDDEMSVMLSTAVSICGVSAAIAACGAIQGDRKKLSYVTSLVLIVAIPMIILQPWIVRKLGISDIVGGAWIGGTLDTTGSVVAASGLISENALKVGTIVKFSQNVLIGVAAFLLAVWWSFKKGSQTGERPSVGVIWERFPKFVLGFLATSLFFSFLLRPELVKGTKGLLTGLRTTWFALAFTSIGLETRFTELVSIEGGRPGLAFISAQAFNIIWTLLIAFLLFGGILFPAVKF
jgi:uncharacterized integral membrane protein (TIGR00698 family)